jgi:hypothetical protein
MCKEPEQDQDGIHTPPEVKTWEEFCQLIINERFTTKKEAADSQNGKYHINDYIWRGHRCENWPLISYFDREFEKHYSKDYKEDDKRKADLREFILKRHQNSFVYASRDRFRQFGLSVPQIRDWIKKKILNPNHIWALAQHYDVATPMLDWCYSPFVAALFAFEEDNILDDFRGCCAQNKNNSYRVIWGLQFEDVFKNANTYSDKERNDYTFAHFDPMSSDYPRLINQRGLFTITKNGEDIISLVERKWQEAKKVKPAPWLIKIRIRNDYENREAFLRGLNSMGINHMSIYPDIHGAAKFSNIGIEFDDYARFHGQGPEMENDPRNSWK